MLESTIILAAIAQNKEYIRVNRVGGMFIDLQLYGRDGFS